VYGGKKNYLGHSKTDHHEIYVYSDEDSNSFGGEVCLGSDYVPHPGFSGWNEVWVNNICVLYKSSIPYSMTGCDPANIALPYLAYNKIYIPAGAQAIFRCQIKSRTMAIVRFGYWYDCSNCTRCSNNHSMGSRNITEQNVTRISILDIYCLNKYDQSLVFQ
jgi:hypothetical protein